MANQTAGRKASGKGRGEIVQFLPAWATNAATPYYRGGAVLHKLVAGTGNNDGYGTLSRTMDGSVKGTFAGVVERDVSVPAQSGATFADFSNINKYGIPVIRSGPHLFNLSSPTYDYVGRLAWFRDDQTVAITPAAGVAYPVCAGRIIAIGTQNNANVVQVDITGFTGVRPPTFNMNFDTPPTLIASLNNNTVDWVKKAASGFVWTPGRNCYITRAFIYTKVAIDVADMKVQYSISNAVNVDLATITQSTSAVANVNTATVGVALLDTDTFGLQLTSTGNITVGDISISLEMVWLD